MAKLTAVEEAAIASIVTNDLAYIERFMKIPAKSRQRVPFKFWPAQRRLVTNLSGRDIVIKDAQIGCTSAVTGLFLQHTMAQADTTTVIVAHESYLTSRLLHRVGVFYDSIPEVMRPEMDHRSSYEFRFPAINSVLYIGTAQSHVFGRGEPIHRLLFSEEAFYVKGAYENIILPAIERVPETGMVVRESTPNGEGGSFYDAVMAAYDRKGGWKLHQLSWWENPDNVLGEESQWAENVRERTAEELALSETAGGLSDDQIRWRRWKILMLGEMFWQEHLESIDTCFLVAGQPLYDPSTTFRMTKEVYPYKYGIGHAQVWFGPEEGGMYVIGVDPGQGKTTMSAALVWRYDGEMLRHEATMLGLWDGVAMAPLAKELGQYYNNALIVPEANGHGALMCSELRDYPNLYFRRDTVTGKTRDVIGYLTTPSTKPAQMQNLGRKLNQIETHDAEFVRQIRGWMDVGDGRVETNVPDDLFDAGCLGLMGIIGWRSDSRRGYVGSSGWTW